MGKSFRANNSGKPLAGGSYKCLNKPKKSPKSVSFSELATGRLELVFN